MKQILHGERSMEQSVPLIYVTIISDTEWCFVTPILSLVCIMTPCFP